MPLQNEICTGLNAKQIAFLNLVQSSFWSAYKTEALEFLFFPPSSEIYRMYCTDERIEERRHENTKQTPPCYTDGPAVCNE
jgi:glutamyl/glutaminyl-tRNA synthetase